MTDIPDDVVKTAIAAADAELDYWSQAGRSSEFRAAVRAAGRVFVEWEREQIVAIAKTKAHHLKTMRAIGGAAEQYKNAEIALLFEKFADNIRARGK